VYTHISQVVLAFNIAQSACDASRMFKLTVLHSGDFIYVSHHPPTPSHPSTSLTYKTYLPTPPQVCTINAYNIQFLGIHNRPEEFLSPLFNVIICTIVQIFLAYRCIAFAQVTQNPIDRGQRTFSRRVWGLSITFGLGILLSLGSGLGTAAALYVRSDLSYVGDY
jgi:hypothetical protein